MKSIIYNSSHDFQWHHNDNGLTEDKCVNCGMIISYYNTVNFDYTIVHHTGNLTCNEYLLEDIIK